MSNSVLKHIKKLELDRVLELLANEATMQDAKELAANIAPSTDFNTVGSLLENTDDAYKLTLSFSAPSFSGAVNVSSALALANVGSSLSNSQLLDIAEVLRTIRSVRNWAEDCSAVKGTSIEDLFLALNPNKFLEDKINFAIKSIEEINDNASEKLSQIRRKISSNSSKIRDDLEKLIRGNKQKYLQDAIITQRDGRFVVPVKSEYRNEIKGIVHDTSASGSTMFIEPMSVVESNNEIRVLKIEELEEIARILAELSALVSEFSDSIKYSYDALTKLNLIFAKASLAYKMRAVRPKINQNGYVYLKRARHPLINAKTVVPITLQLGGEYNTLIITGPNTGGKTVSLKTVGLLTLMTMCGLLVPADDNTEIAIFENIFADIGDEQSIEQSLSTFSSHMVNIISILNECTANSLVLFDELCAGTDPIEGAALAKSILMELHNKSAKTIATTHYAELKGYAIDTEGVENASCEFDVKTLKPTYKLIIGVPGRSNAFAISSKLGLQDKIIENAREQISDDDLRFERVVASLERTRQEAEEQRDATAKLLAEAQVHKRRAESLEQQLHAKQDKIISEARQKATDIVESTRERSAMLLNELEEMKKQLTAQNYGEMLDKARQGYKKTLGELEDNANPVVKAADKGEKLSGMPKENDIVVINSLNRDATVIKCDNDGKRVFVMSGSIKMWVPLDDLRIKKSGESTEIKKTRKVTGMMSRAQRSVSGELDIRGMACDEAILELDNYIDNAVLSGLETIRIIHGKGTGTLRKAVHTHLRSHKCIGTFRVGTFGEGENGVTIAEIK